jgi:hypothetical protein
MKIQSQPGRYIDIRHALPTGTACAYDSAGQNYVAYADGNPVAPFDFTGILRFADRAIWMRLEAKLTQLATDGRRYLLLHGGLALSINSFGLVSSWHPVARTTARGKVCRVFILAALGFSAAPAAAGVLHAPDNAPRTIEICEALASDMPIEAGMSTSRMRRKLDMGGSHIERRDPGESAPVGDGNFHHFVIDASDKAARR